MKIEVTAKQEKVLELIYENIKENGYTPTLADLRNELNVSSNQAVLNFLNILERKGLIERREGQARGIKISRLGLKFLGKKQMVPVVGIAAAGPYLESFADINFKWVDLPSGIIPNETVKKSEELFVIQISGDSMINAGIDDGDMLLVKKSKEFKSGDIVVARNNNGATVKRFIIERGKRYLQPENPSYERMVIVPSEIEFQGKVILNLSKVK